MILFDLKCGAGHGFEAWFRDGATYDAQAAAGDIACPVCGDTGVAKAPMAPKISKRPLGDRQMPKSSSPVGGGEVIGEVVGGPMVADELRAQLEGLRKKIEENCEPVGDRFAEEARRIHYGESPHRDIYGQATDVEAAELADEGIDFARIPLPIRTDS